MRKTVVVLGLLVTVYGLAACGDDDDSSSSNAGSAGTAGAGASGGAGGQGGGASGSAGTAGSGGSPYDGVRVFFNNVYLSPDGDQTISKIPTNADSYSADVENAGVFMSYPGVVGTDSVDCASVPDGDYYFHFVRSLPEGSPFTIKPQIFHLSAERELDLGVHRTERPDTSTFTQTSPLVFGGSLSIPWRAYAEDGMGNVTQPYDDSLYVISTGAGVCGLAFVANNTGESLANGATSLDGFSADTVDTFQAVLGDDGLRLIEGDKGDETILIHSVTHGLDEVIGPVDPANPWTSGTYEVFEEVAKLGSVQMVDGVETTLNGDFQPLPMISANFDFRLEEMLALYPSLPEQGALGATFFSASILWEPGGEHSTPNYFGENIAITASAGEVPEDPACYPNDIGECDPVACSMGCNSNTVTVWPGNFQHTFEFGDLWGDQGLYIIGGSSSITWRVENPSDGSNEGLLFAMGSAKPFDPSGSNVIAPQLGFVKNVALSDQPLSLDSATSNVGTSPVLTFDAPDLGTATSYRIFLYDSTDIKDADGFAVVRRQLVANFTTTKTTLTIPPGLLSSGTYYYLQIEAHDTPYDPKHPGQFRSTGAYSRLSSGLFTP